MCRPLAAYALITFKLALKMVNKGHSFCIEIPHLKMCPLSGFSMARRCLINVHKTNNIHPTKVGPPTTVWPPLASAAYPNAYKYIKLNLIILDCFIFMRKFIAHKMCPSLYHRNASHTTDTHYYNKNRFHTLTDFLLCFLSQYSSLFFFNIFIRLDAVQMHK